MSNLTYLFLSSTILLEMRNKIKKKLEDKGWRIGSPQEFLSLSEQDMALIEIKRILIKKIKEIRQTNKVTQTTLAKMLESSQSRIAKLEASPTEASLDLICRTLLTLGSTPQEIGKALLKI